MFENVRRTVAEFLAGDYIRQEIQRAEMAVMEDWWAKTNDAAGTQDRSWIDREKYLEEALRAWAINPFARRIVNLHTSHVVGRGLTVGANDPDVDAWIRKWWRHPKNRLDLEVYELADELTRAGELFIALFTNPANGMQYVRAIPARRVLRVDTDPEDYKRELVYHEIVEGLSARAQADLPLQTKPWLSPQHDERKNHPERPVMVHYAVNRPVGAVRSWGGDLDPMLPWIDRYNRWLKDRVRLNQNRSAWAWKMAGANEARRRELEQEYGGGLTAGSVWIGGPGDELDTVSARVDAGDAEADGRALRQVIATAGNVAPHMLGDTRMATRATAREANLPTFQWYVMRQKVFVSMMVDLARLAVTRAHQSGKFLRWLPADLEFTHEVADITRDDNRALAEAGKTIVDMMATMAEEGWIDRQTAIAWAAKFAGESLDPEEIIRRIDNPLGPQGIQRRGNGFSPADWDALMDG